jgi:hypothetical protein
MKSVGPFQTVPAIPVRRDAGIGHDKTGFSGNILWFNCCRQIEIYNISAVFADKMDVVRQIAVIAVFHPVELQRFDQAAD